MRLAQRQMLVVPTVLAEVEDLLRHGVPPLPVVRLAVDGWEAKNLRTAIQNVPLAPLPDGLRRWWFIDEVSAASGEWAPEIKWLRDNVMEFSDATVVPTGSSAESLTTGAGTLAGRRGQVDRADRTLMPMGFRSFASTWHQRLELPVLRLADLHSKVAEEFSRPGTSWT